MHPHTGRNGTSDRSRVSEVGDEYATDTQSTDQKRNNRILDALETRYHKGGIGRLLYSAPNIIERKKKLPEEISSTSIYKMTEIYGEYLATTFISNED